MEDSRLTDDQVRDLFSAYHDRELPQDQHDAVRAALEASPALQGEYDGFCKMLDAMSSMGLGGGAPTPGVLPPAPRVDLLRGVHRKLHKRSGGRLFNDAWSRTVGLLPLEVLSVVVLVGLLLAWLAMTQISVRPVTHAPDGPGPSAPAPAR